MNNLRQLRSDLRAMRNLQEYQDNTIKRYLDLITQYGSFTDWDEGVRMAYIALYESWIEEHRERKEQNERAIERLENVLFILQDHRN